MSIWVFIGVMIGTGVADVFWTLYFLEVGNKSAAKAALWATLIIVLGGFNVTMYGESPWYIAAAAIGAFMGTYLTVKYKK
jgi:hypothetical protein